VRGRRFITAEVIVDAGMDLLMGMAWGMRRMGRWITAGWMQMIRDTIRDMGTMARTMVGRMMTARA
jgi:hypothetical protein